MNPKKSVVLTLIVLLLFVMQLAAKKTTPEPEKKPLPISIAPQVAAVWDADIQQRKNRTDIPVTFLQALFLPAQQNQIYPIFLFQIKNVDLNFSAPLETPEILKAKHLAFVRVYHIENGAAAIVKEHYIPFELEDAKQSFLPEAINYYSIAGDIYPAGTYLLAFALSTPDFSKIATFYHEFILPDTTQITAKLDTTPIFSVRSLQQLPTPETRLAIHKNSFIYSILLLDPNLNNEFKVNENLDLFFFVLGAKADANNGFNLQITYKFKKDGKEINKLTPMTVNNTIISQPIAFTFTEITRDAKGNEKSRLEKKFEPGDYTLEIELLDNVAKVSGLKEFKFRIVL